MKKTFNLYCILLVVALIATQILNFEDNMNNFVRGFREGSASANNSWQKGNDATPYNPDHAHFIKLYPNDYQQTNDSLINALNGQVTPVNIYSIDVYSPDFTIPSSARWCSFFSGLFGIIAALLMFPSFILVIITINRGQIFTNRLYVLLNLLGISLIAFFFYSLFDGYSEYCTYINNFALEGYSICKPSPNEINLFFGIGLLAMAQVIKMSKKMKEEQELTI